MVQIDKTCIFSDENSKFYTHRIQYSNGSYYSKIYNSVSGKKIVNEDLEARSIHIMKNLMNRIFELSYSFNKKQGVYNAKKLYNINLEVQCVQDEKQTIKIKDITKCEV